MAMERDLAVMWAMYRGWSDVLAAQQTGLSSSTVYRARRRLAESLAPVSSSHPPPGYPGWKATVAL